jgi:uncharacterized membrane protein
MQMVKKFFMVLLISWFALLLFMPKEKLYYKLEEKLEKQGIKINEKNIEEGLFTLKLKHASVYVKGINIATVEEVTFFTLLLYTRVKINHLVVDASLKNMIPLQTDKAKIEYLISSLYNISLKAEGSFGIIDGKANLKERTFHLDFVEAKEIESIKALLNKDEKGWHYETSF